MPGFANPLGVEPLRRACLLVVDGLGWELLAANRRVAPVLAGAAERGRPVTTGFPSTTSTSLASIGTGLPPGRHGLVGYTIALPGLERAFNCLRWSPYGLGGAKDLRDRFVPEQVQPEPTAFEAAAADGVEVTSVGAGQFAASGFTRAALRGGGYWRTHSLGDQADGALRGLGKGRRSLVYLYHPDLDRTGHVRGTDAEAWRLELAHVDQLVGQIAERLAGDAALFVTGDHGMVDLRPRARRPGRPAGAGRRGAAAGRRGPGQARPHPAGRRRRRARHLAGAARPRHVGRLRRGGHRRRLVRPPGGRRGPARIGDVVAAAHGPIGVVQREVDPTQALLTGHHGSMTPAEQLVPFLELRR